MKILYFTIALILLQAKGTSQISGDTLYVSQITGERNRQVIFVDGPHSSFHKMVFENLLSDSSLFNKNLDLNIQSGKNREGISYFEYIGDWITVHKYRGKLFAYYPSEPFYNTFIRITDSTLIVNDFNEGFVTLRILKRRRKKSMYTFELSGYSGTKHTLSIEFKNGKHAEVKSTLFNVPKLYFVRRQSFFDLPIIVNSCSGSRCEEFNFK